MRASATVVLVFGLVLAAGCQQNEPPPTQLLPAVAQSFREEYPETRIRSVEAKPQSDGTVRYKVKFLDRYDYAHEAVFDQHGNWLYGDRASWIHPRP